MLPVNFFELVKVAVFQIVPDLTVFHRWWLGKHEGHHIRALHGAWIDNSLFLPSIAVYSIKIKTSQGNVADNSMKFGMVITTILRFLPVVSLFEIGILGHLANRLVFAVLVECEQQVFISHLSSGRRDSSFARRSLGRQMLSLRFLVLLQSVVKCHYDLFLLLADGWLNCELLRRDLHCLATSCVCDWPCCTSVDTRWSPLTSGLTPQTAHSSASSQGSPWSAETSFLGCCELWFQYRDRPSSVPLGFTCF